MVGVAGDAAGVDHLLDRAVQELAERGDVVVAHQRGRLGAAGSLLVGLDLVRDRLDQALPDLGGLLLGRLGRRGRRRAQDFAQLGFDRGRVAGRRLGRAESRQIGARRLHGAGGLGRGIDDLLDFVEAHGGSGNSVHLTPTQSILERRSASSLTDKTIDELMPTFEQMRPLRICDGA